MTKRRVVVTGIGALSPLALTAEETWKALLSGKSGIGRITLFNMDGFSSRIAGEVKGFDPLRYMDKKDVKKMDRFIHFAVAAADQAVSDANLNIGQEIARRVGVFVGSGIGGLSLIEDQARVLMERGPSRITPFFIPGLIINLASGQISIKYGARGPNLAVSTACSTGSHAIGLAKRIIENDEADAMICGGSEAAVTPLAVAGFSSMKALSTRNEEPERASRPYDFDRDGFVMGEGAGILMLESLDFAKKRGAKIYCEIVGFGMNGDAYHITAPADDAMGPSECMQRALENANIKKEEIGYINAHGTSTPAGDRIETLAIKRVFGEHSKRLVISSTKSMTGHLLGAAGGLEAVVCILSLRDNMVHPTINLEKADPECDLNYVPNVSQNIQLKYVMSNSFGFGGTNSCLIFKSFTE